MNGVIYLVVGSKRNVVAVVSLWALRKFYRGPICVLSSESPDGHAVAKRITEDKRLSLDLRLIPIVPVRKHSMNVTKTWLHRYSPFEKTIFLDADTIPMTDFEELWPKTTEMVLTRFANWNNDGPKIKSRVEWWKGIRPDLVDKCLAKTNAAVNTGVFGFTRDSEMLESWHQLTLSGYHTFICDEIAAQLIYPDFEHRMLDDRFNCSSCFGVNKNDVRIWHCHGGKHLRPNTKELWLSLFKECWDENIGGINEWLSSKEIMLYV